LDRFYGRFFPVLMVAKNLAVVGVAVDFVACISSNLSDDFSSVLSQKAIVSTSEG